MRQLQSPFSSAPQSIPTTGWFWPVTCILAALVAVTYALPADAQNQPPAQGQPNAAQPSPPLPSWFKPPQTPPEILSIDKPLLPADAGESFKQVRGKFDAAVLNGNLSAQSLLEEGIRYRVLRMADKSERDDLSARRLEIIRDLRQCARLQNNQNQAEQFRQFFLSEVVKRTTELLDNNFYVRLNAVILLTQLNEKEGNPVRRVPAVPYGKTFEPLLQVVGDASQPEAVKLIAAKGIHRLALDANLTTDQRIAAARVLTDELKKFDAHSWYQVRVAEAMGVLNIDRVPVAGQSVPLLQQGLVEALSDPRRHWMVRSEAASAIGRSTLDGQIRVDFIANRIADLTWQMAVAYTRNPRQFFWPNCFVKVYLAFRPADDAEKARDFGLLLKVASGPLKSNEPAVQAAFNAIHPLTAHMVKQDLERPTAFPNAVVQGLQQYLSASQPTDFRIAPGTPPIGAPASNPSQPQPQPSE